VWILALLVFGATIVTFHASLSGEWLEWDDQELLLDITTWHDFSPKNVGWMLTTFHMGPYQPLSWLSYALDHEIWGLDARGYHLTNVLLHAASAACLYLLARKLLALALRDAGATPIASMDAQASVDVPGPWVEIAAVASALLWSLHPLRVESVAWITERRDCLSGLFFVLTVVFWLEHVEGGDPKRRRRAYRLALICFVASLLAKGLGMVLPLVLIALDVWPLRRLGAKNVSGEPTRMRSLWFEKWPFFLAASLAAALAFVGQRVTGAMVEAKTHGLADRITQAFFGIAYYVRKTIWPKDLMVLEPIPVPFDVGESRFVVAELAVVIVAVVLFLGRRRWPGVVVASACYVMLVAPVLGLFQTGSQLVASRYSYLPAIPLSLLAGGGLLLLASRVGAASESNPTGRSRSRSAVAVLLVGCAALVPLARAASKECRVWHDTVSLWQHDLAIDPSSGPARRGLIVAYLNQGRAASDPAVRHARFQNALEEVRRGLEQGPDPAYHSHAAKVHSLLASDSPADGQRHLSLALDHAQRGIELQEKSARRKPDVYETCGVILSKLGRPAEAVPMFQKAVALGPASALRHGLLAGALMQAGRFAEAAVELEAARRIAPDDPTIWLELGNARRALGERTAAIDAYRRFLEIQQARLGPSFSRDEDCAFAYRSIVELTPGR
jgi:tetratricopeptide (TPR) repeat protein